MTRYAIHRIHLFPAFKFGCLVGGVIMLLPGLLLGLLARLLVGILRRWLEAWETLSLGPVADVNPLNILKLADFLRELQVLDEQGWLLALALALGVAFSGGLLAGWLAATGAAVYNLLAGLSGGVVLSAEVLDGAVAPAAMPLPSKGRTAPLPQARAGPVPLGALSPQTGPGIWLVLSQNPQLRWPLKTGTTTLGSAPDNNVVLAGLAPRHAEVRLEGNRYVLHDLGSGQTWVNDRLIDRPNMLKEGFKVRLGGHELIFRKT